MAAPPSAADAGANEARNSDADADGQSPVATDSQVDASPDAAEGAFSPEAWLRGHGITAWKHDEACWWKSSAPPGVDACYNECTCKQELALVTPTRVELMVCTRVRETRETRISHLRRSVIYDGVLRVVLDVPTAAALDPAAFGLYGAPGVPSPKPPIGNVSLEVSADQAELVVSDNEERARRGASCVDALAAAGAKSADVRRVYSKVCAPIGRWRWVGGQLARQQAKKP